MLLWPQNKGLTTTKLPFLPISLFFPAMPPYSVMISPAPICVLSMWRKRMEQMWYRVVRVTPVPLLQPSPAPPLRWYGDLPFPQCTMVYGIGSPDGTISSVPISQHCNIISGHTWTFSMVWVGGVEGFKIFEHKKVSSFSHTLFAEGFDPEICTPF